MARLRHLKCWPRGGGPIEVCHAGSRRQALRQRMRLYRARTWTLRRYPARLCALLHPYDHTRRGRSRNPTDLGAGLRRHADSAGGLADRRARQRAEPQSHDSRACPGRIRPVGNRTDRPEAQMTPKPFAVPDVDKGNAHWMRRMGQIAKNTCPAKLWASVWISVFTRAKSRARLGLAGRAQ